MCVCRMFSDFTTVVQGITSEVISSYRCRMNMGMIVKVYWMCTLVHVCDQAWTHSPIVY